MVAIRILLGALLLALGRKLYWLFVAAVGFAAGFMLVTQVLGSQSEWLIWVFAIGAGVLGAILAAFFQRLAVSLAGFLAGGLIASTLAGSFGLNQASYFWIAFVIGGIIGMVLVSLIFDWALISLSSLAGAVMITGALDLSPSAALLTGLVLVIAGVAIQASWMRKERH